MTSSFSTLLRREWMQHHRGWLVLVALPPLLVLAILGFSPKADLEPKDPLALLVILPVVVIALVMTVAWLVTTFQMPGLARRDQQDRSIEFWLSLPQSPAASVGAMLLMHGLLMPLLALAIGAVTGLAIGTGVAAFMGGASGLASIPWGAVVVAGLAGVARLALGVVLATLWASPLVMVPTVGSAALKRWGVPAVLAVVVIGGLVLEQVYGITLPREVLAGWLNEAGRAVIQFDRTGGPLVIHMHSEGNNIPQVLEQFPTWAARDAMGALSALAQPLFAAALAVSGACYAALVVLRRRGA